VVLDLLPALALALAWATFRVNRSSGQKTALSSAQALLRAVRDGMIQGPSGGPGWGELYFSKVYTLEVHGERTEETRQRIMSRHFDQVFVVPAEPLRLLATASPDPISPRTVAAANTALWRVEVFNQLVFAQTAFNAEIAAELTDRCTTESGREDLAEAAALLSGMVHGDGIGGANAPGGWYRELKDAVESNINELEQRISLVRRYLDERILIALDVALVSIVVTAAATH
jgi:hypothetical protein